ncbi:MFS general substrate transporter [Apiospora phragmitis]|uniref:MFS general substrate transporter n=1 Tax=Apiospora phragmitis TaxID=2905665 RepID=A0ABR1TB97_9PEZI
MASPTASESKIEAQRDGADVTNSAVPLAYEEAPYSAVDEKKLVAKLDRRIVPLVMLSYTLSFLDSSGFSTFLPTIIKNLGDWSTAEVQLLTVPCYFLGAVAYMTTAWFSDRVQRRAVFVVIFGCVSVVGYGILLSNSPSGVQYFGCFMIAMGLYIVVGLPLAWLPNNCPRYGKRTTACGMNLTIGNASGIMAPFIYLTAEGPRYIRGNAVSLSMVGMSVSIYSFLWFWFQRENKRRDAGQVAPEHQHLSEEEMTELGDESPHYRYTY